MWMQLNFGYQAGWTVNELFTRLFYLCVVVTKLFGDVMFDRTKCFDAEWIF